MAVNKKQALTAAMLSVLIVLSMTGCNKNKDKPKDTSSSDAGSQSASSEEASTESETASPSDSSSQELALIGTRLSWVVPPEYKTSEITDGWVAYDQDAGTAIIARKESLVLAGTNYDATNRINDSLLESRLLDVVEGTGYEVYNCITDKVTIAEQPGYLLKGTYQVDEGGSPVDYSIVAHMTQFDTDVVAVVVTRRGTDVAQATGLINTITAAREIHTTWK